MNLKEGEKYILQFPDDFVVSPQTRYEWNLKTVTLIKLAIQEDFNKLGCPPDSLTAWVTCPGLATGWPNNMLRTRPTWLTSGDAGSGCDCPMVILLRSGCSNPAHQ